MTKQKTTTIRLVAAFKGVKFIPPPFVLGTNNANPKLIIKEDSVEYRNLFFTSVKGYNEIEKVDVFINKTKFLGVMTTNIILNFSNSMFTFLGNLNDLDRLKKLVVLLRDKGCPISEKAQELINADN